MFYLSGGIHLLSGMDVLWSMIVVIPFVASFSVLLIFILAKILFKSDGAAIIAGAFTAVAMPHVFATSHPMPGSLGDVLLIFTILLLLASFKNKKFILLLIPTAFALTITHHLSSYFLFIMVFGGLFVEEILKKEDKGDTRFAWAFLIFILTVMILYWMLLAQPFAERVVGNAFGFPYQAVLLVGYIAIFLAYFIIKLRKRFDWRFEPKFPDPWRQVIKYLLLLSVLSMVLALVAFTTLLGTGIQLEPAILLMFSPFLILTAFGSVGPGYLRFYKNGMALYGWIIALLLSSLIGLMASSRVLLPYRHTQYLIVPLALLIGIGLVMMYNMVDSKKRTKKLLAIGLVAVLLALCALSAYPPKELIGGFQEGTSEADMQAVAWAKSSLNEDATVASDHRMSSIIFGFGGLNATWDEAYSTLHADNYNGCRSELENISTPSGEKPIDYILLDDDIKSGAALLQWENAEPMSSEAQEKFEKWPFVKLYESNGVEVYGIVKQG
jgi:hypothetical protein